MYTTSHIIYGISPNGQDIYDIIKQYNIADAKGFHTAQSGDGKYPIWIGHKLDTIEHISTNLISLEQWSKDNKQDIHKLEQIYKTKVSDVFISFDKWMAAGLCNEEFINVMDEVEGWIYNSTPTLQLVFGIS